MDDEKRPELILAWIPVDKSRVPPAFAIPFDSDTYLIRVRDRNTVIPGQWLRNKQCSEVMCCGLEDVPFSFEVLCDTRMDPMDDRPPCEWLPGSRGKVPSTAIQAGITEWMEPLYIARIIVNHKWYAGFVQSSRRGAIFLIDGVERKLRTYDVLCSVE
ncbi:unnamed protein product [Echinostoma caproni]|uniref:DUF3421 domain-containing protein n=1 Tax=Echinostoma caproni TaxID=27848 RepID=A0A183AF28_9TREM|nr:unnamed protein product [Echinostoma caproni]